MSTSTAYRLEYKEASARKTEVGTGRLVAYVAEFNTVDRANERIQKGAFRNLSTFVQDGFLALNHDWGALPIATIESATQDDFGLKISAMFHGTPDAQSARTVMLERMERGRPVRFSIGYRVLDDAMMTENGRSYRLLKSIELLEASFVNVPANAQTYALSVKAHPRVHRGERADPAMARLALADYERQMKREARERAGSEQALGKGSQADFARVMRTQALRDEFELAMKGQAARDDFARVMRTQALRDDFERAMKRP